MLVTIRRRTENNPENIIALNKFLEHPHLQFSVCLGFFCPSYHHSLTPEKKKKKKDRLEEMQGNVATLIQGLQQFLY